MELGGNAIFRMIHLPKMARPQHRASPATHAGRFIRPRLKRGNWDQMPQKEDGSASPILAGFLHQL